MTFILWFFVRSPLVMFSFSRESRLVTIRELYMMYPWECWNELLVAGRFSCRNQRALGKRRWDRATSSAAEVNICPPNPACRLYVPHVCPVPSLFQWLAGFHKTFMFCYCKAKYGYDVKLIRCCPQYDVKLMWRHRGNDIVSVAAICVAAICAAAQLILFFFLVIPDLLCS